MTGFMLHCKLKELNISTIKKSNLKNLALAPKMAQRYLPPIVSGLLNNKHTTNNKNHEGGGGVFLVFI